MKSNPLRSMLRGVLILALPVAVNQIPAQTLDTSNSTTVQSNAPTALIDARIEKANALLDYILAPTNADVLAIYPPDYIDTLEGITNGTLAATCTMLDGPQPVSTRPLNPGDKANMHWLDAQFVMGSPTSEAERNSDEGQYTAVISYGFYMGNFEVTQYEYQQVVGSNPSWFTSANGYTDNLNRPVESITWLQASNYCYLLTQQAQTVGSIPAGWEYRLPTETEWEYSCRAMTYGQQGVQTAPPQLPFTVPWTDPFTGYTYAHYFMGDVSMDPYQGLAYIVYFNDDALTADTNGGVASVGSLGGHIGTIYTYGHEQAYIDEGSDVSHAIEFAIDDVTTIPWSANNYTWTNGDGSAGYHFVVVGSYPWFTSPWWFSSSVEVDSSTGNGVLYTPDLETYNTFSFGNAVHGGMANFNDNYEYNSQTGTVNVSSPIVTNVNMTTNVGSYAANRFGLSDMHGNVSEWCQDWYGPYPTTTTVDPQGPTNGTARVVRGGSWADHGVQLRSAARAAYDPSTVTNTIGFRIVLAPVTPDWKVAVNTVPSSPVYGTPPVRNRTNDSLVLITHGWQPFPRQPDVSWMYAMSNDVVQYFGSTITNWQVYAYDWVHNAWQFSPDTARTLGKQEGINLGKSLATQGWKSIHFISHSAGAELIQTAVGIVKANSPSTVVQCTFLDPYIGSDFTGEATYGSGADWSDRYAAHGDIENLTTPLTDAPLYGAYNVDVTDLDPASQVQNWFSSKVNGVYCALFQSSHGWAYQFYENSITNPAAYDGFGFPLSIEAGGWPSAPEQYPVGNVTSVTNLGTSPSCAGSVGLNQPVLKEQIDFSINPFAAKSLTGTITPSGGTVTLITGSPAWLSIVPTNTEPVDLLSFAANFTSSGAGAAGLLSVYWDSNLVGTVDETVVGEGVGQYSMRFPVTQSNSTHVLSFRLDPFTNVQSTVVLTNVVLSQVGVTLPFTLSTTTNTIDGFAVWQLTGEPGFDYGLQASTNLTDWNQIAILENTNGVVTFYDPDSTNYTSRFYRAVAPY